MINLGKINNGKEVILKEKENGCLECISHCKDEDGYIRFMYNHKQNRLHRVLYELKYGPIPKGMVLRHKCDNPSCCNVEHLEIGTQYDNVQDMVNRNRTYKGIKPSLRGSKNKASKLTEKQVIEIYLSNFPYNKLAKLYNVSVSNIKLIKNKKQWKWLTDKIDQ